MRCKTKQAQKPLEDFRDKIVAWPQFNRRNTIKNIDSDCGILRSIDTPLVGRFKLSEIANMDQTPISFEFLSSRTYDFKGVKTVWVKEQRSGWDRRQATLQVCVFADGIKRCQPLLIYHGDPIGDSRRRAEEKLYDKRVCVAFNKTAWADSYNLQDWVKRQYASASPYFVQEKEPRLLCLDAFAPQMTQQLRDEFKKLNCTTSYIPGGCTGFVQPLNVSLNKPLKALVAQAAADHADKFYNRYAVGGFTVGERRVLLTQWVGDAWDELHVKYKKTIIETFQRVGLTLNPDGSEDHKLKIKGLDDIKVGDFRRKELDPENGLGSLTAIDVAAVEAAQLKLEERVAKAREKDPAESSDEEEEHEEVFTLGRMGTRSQTQVNRYYAAEEAEEGPDVDGSSHVDIDDEPPEFDPSDDEEYSESVDGDSDIMDENM
jgi:hypothetical protein